MFRPRSVNSTFTAKHAPRALASPAFWHSPTNVLLNRLLKCIKSPYQSLKGSRKRRISAENSGGLVKIDFHPIAGNQAPLQRWQSAGSLRRKRVRLVHAGRRPDCRACDLYGIDKL